MKVMTFNIWHGGHLDRPEERLARQNIDELLEFLRLTRQPGRPKDKDNLWLFTWLPVRKPIRW